MESYYVLLLSDQATNCVEESFHQNLRVPPVSEVPTDYILIQIGRMPQA